MHSIIETPTFLSDAQEAGLTEEDRQYVIDTISADPKAGAIMKGTGGMRKLRFAYPGEGKSGSYRTVHYYGGDDVPVFMFAVIKKRERDNLSQAERNALKKIVSTLVKDYRESVKKNATKARRKK